MIKKHIKFILLPLLMMSSCEDEEKESPVKPTVNADSVCESGAAIAYAESKRVKNLLKYEDESDFHPTEVNGYTTKIMGNSTSKAAYGLSLLGVENAPRHPRNILNKGIEVSVSTTVRPADALDIFKSRKPSEAEFKEFEKLVLENIHPTDPSKFKLSSTLKRNLIAKVQLEECQLRGYGVEDCLKGLYMPWVYFTKLNHYFEVVENQTESELSAEDLEVHLKMKKVIDSSCENDALWFEISNIFYDEEDRFQDSKENKPTTEKVVYNKAGGEDRVLRTTSSGITSSSISGFLSQASLHLTGGLDTLEKFSAKYGDYKTWDVSMYRNSAAKRMGRRVYRNHELKISVAETLYVSHESEYSKNEDPTKNLLKIDKYKDCDVMEIEIIREKNDGTLEFWSFTKEGESRDFGEFPNGSVNQTIALSTPLSCTDCHYNFKTRVINERIPSSFQLRMFEHKGSVRRTAHHCPLIP